MIEYHEPGVVCCNSLNPCEKHEKKPAAQSDAPSARKFSGSDAKAWWWENVKSSPFKMTPERIWAHCEAYAALRTAKMAEQLTEALDALGEVGISNAKILSELSTAESALSEARERAQALADWLEWKQRHSAERAQQCGEQGSDQLKTFNLGMVDCVQSVIQTDEYRQLRQLLLGHVRRGG